MDNFSIQFFLNSGPIPYFTVLYAERLASKRGRFSLIGFLLAVFGINAALNLDRYAPLEAVARGSAFALVVAMCIFGFAFHRKRRRANRTKSTPGKTSAATAADTPASPPDRAP